MPRLKFSSDSVLVSMREAFILSSVLLIGHMTRTESFMPHVKCIKARNIPFGISTSNICKSHFRSWRSLTMLSNQEDAEKSGKLSGPLSELEASVIVQIVEREVESKDPVPVQVHDGGRPRRRRPLFRERRKLLSEAQSR